VKKRVDADFGPQEREPAEGLVTSENVLVERSGPVTTLTLHREDAANAINAETALSIAEAIGAFAADDSARVLVVTGTGDRSFCAGGDLNELLEITGHGQADRAGPLGFTRLDPGKPTIAAINGHCYGGGLELALWCDWRIAGENVQFGALNRQWGLTLIDGGTQRLPRIVGYGNAMWLICTGCRIDAQRALGIGLVQEVVPAGQALPRTLELARALAQVPQPALIADRRAVVASTEQALEAGLDFEARVGRAALRDPDVIQRLTDYRERDA
jgi:enoyl-CoA hydratase